MRKGGLEADAIVHRRSGGTWIAVEVKLAGPTWLVKLVAPLWAVLLISGFVSFRRFTKRYRAELGQ
ncbi:hypothetical protein [Candidatus Poriferisodalis sp.]|uniref:hypothetical protein n=1 Tax=Candidatus Poriferisodalis sp. TaxID=3101277 RepID=UPI003B014D1D